MFSRRKNLIQVWNNLRVTNNNSIFVFRWTLEIALMCFCFLTRVVMVESRTWNRKVVSSSLGPAGIVGEGSEGTALSPPSIPRRGAPQLLPGRRSINGCPLLRVCVHGVCIYIYSFSTHFYPKRLTIEEYNKRYIIKRQTVTGSACNTTFQALFIYFSFIYV